MNTSIARTDTNEWRVSFCDLSKEDARALYRTIGKWCRENDIYTSHMWVNTWTTGKVQVTLLTEDDAMLVNLRFR